MLEIVNQAAPSSSVEQPHDAPQVEQTEIKGDKKPAAKSKAKSAAKPAKKADKKKKDNKKKNKGKDEKKKSKKLEDLLGKKYAVPTSAEKNIQIDVQPAEKTEIIVTPINKADKPVVPPKNVMPQETPKEDDKSDDNAQNLFGTGRSLFVQEFRAEVVVGEVTNERVFTENPGEEPSKSVETETFSESGNETNQQTEIFDGSQAAPTPQIITEQQ